MTQIGIVNEKIKRAYSLGGIYSSLTCSNAGSFTTTIVNISHTAKIVMQFRYGRIKLLRLDENQQCLY